MTKIQISMAIDESRDGVRKRTPENIQFWWEKSLACKDSRREIAIELCEHVPKIQLFNSIQFNCIRLLALLYYCQITVEYDVFDLMKTRPRFYKKTKLSRQWKSNNKKITIKTMPYNRIKFQVNIPWIGGALAQLASISDLRTSDGLILLAGGHARIKI